MKKNAGVARIHQPGLFGPPKQIFYARELDSVATRQAAPQRVRAYFSQHEFVSRTELGKWLDDLEWQVRKGKITAQEAVSEKRFIVELLGR